MTARRILNRAMTERQLQDAVLEYAARLGYLTWHLSDDAMAVLALVADGKPVVPHRKNPSLLPPPGLPDTILVHPGRPDWPLVLAEVKTSKGVVRDDQRAFLDALVAWSVSDERRFIAEVWRPDDWTTGRIDRLLQPNK